MTFLFLVYTLLATSISLLILVFLRLIGKKDLLFSPQVSEKDKTIGTYGFLLTGLITLYASVKAIWF